MPLQMMWSPRENLYRGQAQDGTVMTVEEPAMLEALKQAGKGVFEADWWSETLPSVLERWGLHARRWTDDVTQMPRVHYSLGVPSPPSQRDLEEELKATTGPLNARLIARKKGEGD